MYWWISNYNLPQTQFVSPLSFSFREPWVFRGNKTHTRHCGAWADIKDNMLIWLPNMIFIRWSSRISFPKKPLAVKNSLKRFCGLPLVYTITVFPYWIMTRISNFHDCVTWIPGKDEDKFRTKHDHNFATCENSPWKSNGVIDKWIETNRFFWCFIFTASLLMFKNWIIFSRN